MNRKKSKLFLKKRNKLRLKIEEFIDEPIIRSDSAKARDYFFERLMKTTMQENWFPKTVYDNRRSELEESYPDFTLPEDHDTSLEFGQEKENYIQYLTDIWRLNLSEKETIKQLLEKAFLKTLLSAETESVAENFSRELSQIAVKRLWMRKDEASDCRIKTIDAIYGQNFIMTLQGVKYKEKFLNELVGIWCHYSCNRDDRRTTIQKLLDEFEW